MKAERIGTTARAQLKWALTVAYRTEPLSDGDRLNLFHEASLFAMGAIVPIPIESDRYIATMLDAFRQVIDSAIAHNDINALRRPYAPLLVWDEQAGRYKRHDRESEVFETRVINRLGELILSHGHLLKRCEAPAKMKPGPKPKKAPNAQPVGKCAKPFLAIKKTQLYCSPACLDRALVHRKKPKGKKKKKPKK